MAEEACQILYNVDEDLIEPTKQQTIFYWALTILDDLNTKHLVFLGFF